MFREKALQAVTFLNNIKEEYKAVLIRGAVFYMAMKIGFILLATIFASIFLINSAIQNLTSEMTKTGVIVFTSFLGLIFALKVYFVVYMLATYNRSREIIVSLIGILSLNMKRSLYKMRERVHTGLPSFSLEKSKIHIY